MGLFNKLFGKKEHPSTTKETEGFNIDLTKVYPRIKRLYDEETPDSRTSDNKIELNTDDLPIYEPIVKGLGLFYAVDNGNSYTLLQNRHLSETTTLEKLREVAIKNLTKVTLDKTEIHGDPADVMMIANGGNYETAMILIDSLWNDLERMFKDQICVALPAQDLVFVAGKNNPTSRERLREMVNNAFNKVDANLLLVRHIYTRENNQWVTLEIA